MNNNNKLGVFTILLTITYAFFKELVNLSKKY